MVAAPWLVRLSRWVPFKIPLGESPTTDPVLPTDQTVSHNGLIPKGSKRTPRYEMRQSLGAFEMIGPVKGSGEGVKYLLRNASTGKLITVNRDTLQFLFKSIPMEK